MSVDYDKFKIIGSGFNGMVLTDGEFAYRIARGTLRDERISHCIKFGHYVNEKRPFGLLPLLDYQQIEDSEFEMPEPISIDHWPNEKRAQWKRKQKQKTIVMLKYPLIKNAKFENPNLRNVYWDLSKSEFRAGAASLAMTIKTMWDDGWVHMDAHDLNIVYDGMGNWYLIDYENCKRPDDIEKYSRDMIWVVFNFGPCPPDDLVGLDDPEKVIHLENIETVVAKCLKMFPDVKSRVEDCMKGHKDTFDKHMITIFITSWYHSAELNELSGFKREVIRVNGDMRCLEMNPKALSIQESEYVLLNLDDYEKICQHLLGLKINSFLSLFLRQ